MDAELFEILLLRGESETLDFKVDQYPFAGAPDHEQSEMLKDILAFANAWRETDAYILLGVEEKKGSKAVVHGITKPHLDDHALQQFVNSKTQRPVSFRYEAFAYEGKQVGIIALAVQQRPIYLKKDFGKLRTSQVWIRRGSSTALAEPDEVARMGKSTSIVTRPLFNMEVEARIVQQAQEVNFVLSTWLLNKGGATAYDVVIDFIDDTPDARYESDWETRISPYNTPQKGRRRIALKHPLHPGDHKSLAVWKIGRAAFNEFTAYVIQSGTPFDPQTHEATYAGGKFGITLQILARDQQPVIVAVQLTNTQINSRKRLLIAPRSD